MASHSVGRAGVIIPPSLPTIKETTLSWLGSDLESSLFSTNGKPTDNEGVGTVPLAKVQRYIDFDDQCLSVKSGEGSDFSGIQPLPIGSDDTPPMATNDFNRVVQMNFAELLSDSQNRPKPLIEDDIEEYELASSKSSPTEENFEEPGTSNPTDGIAASDFQALVNMLEGNMIGQNIGDLVGSGDSAVIEKLQLIRMWQLMQQENLRRQQEAEIAMLNAQKSQMYQEPKDYQNAGLEKVAKEADFDADVETQDEDGSQSSDVEEDLEEQSRESSDSNKDTEYLSHPAQQTKEKRSQENHDEIPIESAEKKTFEELLEEEMKKEEVKQMEKEPKGQVKRPFLKKGQGLARFLGPPVRKPRKKSKPTNEIKQNKKESNFDKNQRGENVKKPPIDTSKQVKLQRPSQAQKPTFKIKRTPIQKLQLKPESSTPNQKVQNIEKMPGRGEKPGSKDQDLEEFEMLERYAEDDASFFSEPSLVVSLLQHERDAYGTAVREEGQMSLRDRVRERRRLREEAKRKIQEVHKMGGSTEYINEKEREKESSHFENDLEDTLKNETAKDNDDQDEILSPEPPKAYFQSPEVQKVKVIQRKTASLVKREKLFRPVAQPANCEGFSPIKQPLPQILSNGAFSELHSSPNSAFSPHQQPIIVDGAGKEDVCKYSDEIDQIENNVFEDEQTWGEIDVSVLNTSQSPGLKDEEVAKEDEASSSGRKYKCSDYMEPESEDIENPTRDTDGQIMPGFVESKDLSLSPPPPPTVLMQKLFPGLKMPKKLSSSTKVEEHSDASSEKEKEDSSSENTIKAEESQASVLKQKLEELEKEISKFKKENATLDNLRVKQEEGLKHLSKEMEEFKKQKEEELARLEEFKRMETKKLKKERKLFEEHVLAVRMQPNKEEREEIQKLQQENDSLKAENKAKEQRWISANNRLRNQVERLEEENKSMEERIREMEEQRLKEWNAKKTTRPKSASKWQAVNEIVESAVFDAENENPDRTKLSNESKLASGRGRNSSESGKVRKSLEAEKVPQKSCMKQAKKPKTPLIESKFENMIEPSPPPAPVGHTDTLHKDGKIERTLQDGSKLVEFPNGTQKEISADGQTVKVKFANGDVKQIYADGSIVYFYKENGTTHTTHSDGLQVFEFPNKQVEHHFPDGTKQITFPDQTVKYLHTDGTEQTVFPDGTEMHVAANKDKTIVFANGQREIHTSNFKRREYPDGTSKTVFEDGRQETRYASGRLRVKDAHGNVIVDRMTNGLST